MPKDDLPKKEADFEAYADDDSSGINFMRANTLYVIDVSKQPRKEMVESDFQKGRQVPRYWITAIKEDGSKEELAITGKVYKDIIAFKRRLIEAANSNPDLLLIGYMKPKSNFVATR